MPEVTWKDLTGPQRRMLQEAGAEGSTYAYSGQLKTANRLEGMGLLRRNPYGHPASDMSGSYYITDLGRAVLAQREEASPMAGEVQWQDLSEPMQAALLYCDDGCWRDTKYQTFMALQHRHLIAWVYDHWTLTDLGRAVLAQREEADRG